MEIILLSSRRGSLLRIRLGLLSVGTFALVAAVIAAAVFAGGREWALSRQAAEDMSAEAYARLSSWERAILKQRRELASARAGAERDAKAMAIRLGEMQARVARLDALGERLTVMAGLEPEEFAFARTPPVGGPQSGEDTGVADDASIVADIEDLGRVLERHAQELTALEAVLMRSRLDRATHPAGRPLAEGWISSGFGNRIDPVRGTHEFHSGVDFTGRPDSEVRAVAAGLVAFSGVKAEYGNTVEVHHGDGYLTRYSHNKRNLVKVGDKVEPGQVVGIMGATGRTTGAHVHFEVERDGRIVNPGPYLNAKRD